VDNVEFKPSVMILYRNGEAVDFAILDGEKFQNQDPYERKISKGNKGFQIFKTKEF